jgi:hypothetical protein
MLCFILTCTTTGDRRLSLGHQPETLNGARGSIAEENKVEEEGKGGEL